MATGSVTSGSAAMSCILKPCSVSNVLSAFSGGAGGMLGKCRGSAAHETPARNISAMAIKHGARTSVRLDPRHGGLKSALHASGQQPLRVLMRDGVELLLGKFRFLHLELRALNNKQRRVRTED